MAEVVIGNNLTMKARALVTGGAGFLGSHLCRRLLKDEFEVVALDNLHTGSRLNLQVCEQSPNFQFIEGDVCELQKSLAGDVRFDEIYNLACPASPPHYQAHPLKTLWTSIDGIRNCLELARACGAKVLQASTSEIYGDPIVHPQVETYWGNVNTLGIRSCYDEGKRAAETILTEYRRAYGVDARLIRIFNTYGPNMDPKDGRVISNFILQALNDEPITMYGDGRQTRSFQYCDDLIEAIRRYMSKPKAELEAFFVGGHDGSEARPSVPVVNLGNPGEYTMLELAKEVLRQLPDSRSSVVYRPLPDDDPRQRRPDISLARALLDGWEPKVSLAEGLRQTIAYFRACSK